MVNMTGRIIEDETDMSWLSNQRKRCQQALIDPRTREDEMDGWKVRLSRLDDRMEYLERRK